MELWDLYDAQRRPLGRTHPRGTLMRSGEFHINVFTWIFNSAGQALLTRRSPEKESYPNQWESTGGAVKAGETSLAAIVRELREETGICAAPEEFVLLGTSCGKSWFTDLYALRRDVAISELVFQPGETCGACWVDRCGLERLIAAGELTQPDIQQYRSLEAVFRQWLK